MNQDLKNRIPIAIGYVLLIASLTLSGTWPSILLLGLFLLGCIVEFVSHQGTQNRFSLSIGLALSSILLVYVIYKVDNLGLVVFSCLFFLWNSYTTIFKNQNLIFSLSTIPAVILYLLIPFALAISSCLSFKGFPVILLCTFIILWLNDAGAYFVGRAWGKKKLIPSISPNKTIEGFIGGGLAGLVITFALQRVFGVLEISSWLILAFIIWISGSLGDIIESSWKRKHDIKDSGTLLKGHGGMLDRLDSFIYAIPFVILFIRLLEL